MKGNWMMGVSQRFFLVQHLCAHKCRFACDAHTHTHTENACFGGLGGWSDAAFQYGFNQTLCLAAADTFIKAAECCRQPPSASKHHVEPLWLKSTHPLSLFCRPLLTHVCPVIISNCDQTLTFSHRQTLMAVHYWMEQLNRGIGRSNEHQS